MKAIIESIEKSNNRQSIVYVESPFTKVADDFAMEHWIYSATFKSKVWTKVCKLTNNVNVAALKELFPETTTIRFSHKAGCNCGCSPGFVMKYEHPNQFGKTYWVNVEATEDEVAAFRAKIASSGLAEEFAAERTAHRNKLAHGAVV